MEVFMKYLLCLSLLVGLNCFTLQADMNEILVDSNIIAKNNYNEAVYIPSKWGNLKGVTSHGTFDVLYFEGEDGTIYVVKGYISNNGVFAFSTGASEFVNDSFSDDTQINGTKILRK